jgi:hypothetical protein
MRVLILAVALSGCVYQDGKYYTVGQYDAMILAQKNEEHRQEVARQEEAREAECKRRGPPKVGMTKAQVFKTCWGETGRINRTVTANGVFEQYVYSDTSYVYFENGIVTAIQN